MASGTACLEGLRKIMAKFENLFVKVYTILAPITSINRTEIITNQSLTRHEMRPSTQSMEKGSTLWTGPPFLVAPSSTGLLDSVQH